MLRLNVATLMSRSAVARLTQRSFHASALARNDIIGIDLGTTNSCVAIMEVRQRDGRLAGAQQQLPSRARETALPLSLSLPPLPPMPAAAALPAPRATLARAAAPPPLRRARMCA